MLVLRLGKLLLVLLAVGVKRGRLLLLLVAHAHCHRRLLLLELVHHGKRGCGVDRCLLILQRQRRACRRRLEGNKVRPHTSLRYLLRLLGVLERRL